MELKTILITQARISSTRLPGKILLEIKGKSILRYHLNRISQSLNIDKIIVATTLNIKDNILAQKVKDWGFEIFRGSEDDVLDRFYQSVKNEGAEWIVRVTTDCPLIDPKLIDKVVLFVKKSGCDYGSNILIENFPDGQDIEVFKFSALKRAWIEAKLPSEREHVTTYIRNNSNFNGRNLFSAINFSNDKNYSKIRMTIDEKADYDLLSVLINDFGIDKTWREYADYIIEKKIYNINGKILRNEGLLKSIQNDNHEKGTKII